VIVLFYFIFVIFVIIIFLISQKDNRISTKYLAKTLIALAFTILMMILYLSKDTYYYNVVNNYFSLPKSVWKYLMFIRIPRDTIIRLLNLSSLSVIYLGCRFSLSHLSNTNTRIRKVSHIVILSVMIFQLILYDPLVQYCLYTALYPDILDFTQISSACMIIHTITVVVNNSIILFSIVNLFRINKAGLTPYFFKSYILGESICYTLIMLSYMMILWFSPTFLVKISKIANHVTYLSIPLNQSRIIYNIFPYYLLAATLLMGFCIYKTIRIRKKIDDKDFSIAKQIDASDTASKAICHYIKNELLSIQAELELLETTNECKEEIHDVLKRCENLYWRLDAVHRSTRQSKMVLTETDLSTLVIGLINAMKSDFKNCEVITDLYSEIPCAMVDPNYFEQALHNLFINALDAMESVPVERRKLILSLNEIDNWIVLSIQDTGVGISQENIEHIFTPLFSSQPITKHWGIGLTLVYRIIRAHGGKIEVTSKVNAGTTFKILLPNIRSLMVK
jgi:signal transduction histidine kinase